MQFMQNLKMGVWGIVFGVALTSHHFGICSEIKDTVILEKIQSNRDNQTTLAQLLPIVQCPFKPSKYERILLSELRNTKCSTKEFRKVTKQISELLVYKVVECLPTRFIEVETPITKCEGEEIINPIDLVSIMRSGDALLDAFTHHFPNAKVSKILIQRDEKTAKPHFKYMKLSPTIGSNSVVVITEPMIATGGTLEMAITLLKEKGVHEENIIIAAVCAAPEGLLQLNNKFPNIKVVMTVMDDHLNEKKYIVPGLGDFGDRFFGTE